MSAAARTCGELLEPRRRNSTGINLLNKKAGREAVTALEALARSIVAASTELAELADADAVSASAPTMVEAATVLLSSDILDQVLFELALSRMPQKEIGSCFGIKNRTSERG